MKKYIKVLLTALVFAVSGSAYSQITMGVDPGHPQSNPADCNVYNGAATNFYDIGGAAGNYIPNFNDTLVMCPTLTQGTKMGVTFGINAGYSFAVDGSDSIYVYDGPTTSAPLMGVHNSVTDPLGFTHTASWSNPSGCLTIVFISDAVNEGAGWVASLECGNPAQPFEMHMEAFVNGSSTNALNPIDTGFVDVCLGDSILFVAKPIFPHSFENTGAGYSQNVGNVSYSWNISDGGTYPNNDSIWFVPPTRNGFLVDLKITDTFPSSNRMLSKVRVSQLPIFAGTGPIEDTVCLGENTILVGGVTPSDTVGVTIPGGSYQIGGSFAGLTYLPDGSGQNYVTTINITGFPNNATIQNPEDLNQICLTMEHSWTGDLEIWLECPPVAPATTGNTVVLLNSYDNTFNEAIPGGNSGGGIFLGHPLDNNTQTPGIGWEYCFSSVNNTIGPMNQNWGNTVPVAAQTGPPQLSAGNSMDPSDVYQPETSFGTALAGCPLNGDWKIHVRDNLAQDNGYIFEWGLFFDPSFFSGSAGYQTSAVDTYWSSDPTIVSGPNDTLVNVIPNQTGSHSYIYNLIDNYGCHYDTTVTIYTWPAPIIFPDTIACNFTYNVNGTVAANGGVWSCADTNVHFLPNANVLNPVITSNIPGTFDVTFTDNECGMAITSSIEFINWAYVTTVDTVICIGGTAVMSCGIYPQNDSYVWSNGTVGHDITVTPGVYIVTASNECNSHSDTMTVDGKVCYITAPNIIVLSSTSGNNKFFLSYDGVEEFHISIVNRWGNLITEYNDPGAAWDGRNMNGEVVSEGTYFYKFNAKLQTGEEIEQQGFVQVFH